MFEDIFQNGRRVGQVKIIVRIQVGSIWFPVGSAWIQHRVATDYYFLKVWNRNTELFQGTGIYIDI